MTNAKDRAFPVGVSEGTSAVHGGLSKRELFAAMAMQGDLADGVTDIEAEFAAPRWVAMADTLIAELNRPVSA